MSLTTFKAGIDTDVIAKQGIAQSVPATRMGQAYKDLADEVAGLFSALYGGTLPADLDTLTEITTKVTQMNNILGISGKTIDQLNTDIQARELPATVDSKITTAINNLIGGAPGALNALNELATAMNNDPNFATTMTNALAGKEPSIGAKGTAFNKNFGSAAGTVSEGNHTHNSDSVTEGSTNKFWTNARTITSVLTGYVVAATGSLVLATTDTISQAFGKLEKRMNDFVVSLSNKADLSGGKVPAAQLPVVEFNTTQFEDVGTAPDQLIQIKSSVLSGSSVDMLSIAKNNKFTLLWLWATDTTSRPYWGTQNSSAGTPLAQGYSTASWLGRQQRWGVASLATAGSLATVRQGQQNVNVAQGFELFFKFMIGDPAAVATARTFLGLIGTNADLGIDSADPSTFLNLIGIGNDSADTNFQIMTNDGSGAATKTDTGIPCNTRNTDVVEFVLPQPAGGVLYWSAKRFGTDGIQVGTTQSGTITANVPLGTQKLMMFAGRSNGPTALETRLILFYPSILQFIQG